MILDDNTFIQYAMKHYDNPHCHSIDEFEEDLKRIQYVKKLLKRHSTGGELKERLVLNHLIILYNCFGKHATPMLFLKLDNLHEQLKPFISFLNYLPEYVEYSGKKLNTSSIKIDFSIKERLEGL
jgi:hypothetical protein